ncbi:macrolide-inactivating glycosyltransferase [Streptomyces sulfonofaciens]|uniref:Macrolide-inactivating glycosyltransferase n=1 Tax=Streptomyces sulfonofaciens TaxID=68272 RepID=A0A919G888_9ACTN|nr:macrolide-inactivating glycosyltransferase [Streptomyces sulfonofaciens]GHH79594.1 macrolide-inactivating glycosyltransferase [Streptomyces sulfonofaciens]
MIRRNSSQRAHIAMFSIAAHGHVNPSLPVIRELVARGNRVSYAIPPAFAHKVAQAGAEPRIWHSTLPTDDDPEAWGTELIDHVEPFLADAVQALPQLTAAYQDDSPDLVLYDITAYPARILAHRWGVPIIQLSPNMVAWEGYEEEVGRALFEPLKRTPRGKAFYDTFAGWIAENGMDIDVEHFMGRPDRCLVLIPKVLQPHADRVDRSVYTFVGSCQDQPPAQKEWRRPPGAEKVLLVSLGSTFTKQPGFYRECIEAFGALPGWHTVLAIGRHVDVAELGAIPPQVEVHPWVPQRAILREADAFVTHAGAGGCQEGLATGTPMVAVPQAVDQFGNADILQDLGVARHLPMAEATADALRAAVLDLVGDPEVARRLGEIRAGMAEEGGTARAADLIEAVLRPE